jgi:hypothetical protein
MLTPQEQPYRKNLNSFYLYLDKLMEQMQAEIGSGCISCYSPYQTMMIFFTPYELVRGIIYDPEAAPQSSNDLKSIINIFNKRPFTVHIHSLDLNATYFWAQLLSYKKDEKKIKATASTFSLLQKHFQFKKFSGFIDFQFPGNQSGLLFYDQGQRLGGSYSWGSGGLSPWTKDYRKLFSFIEAENGTFEIGHFPTKGTEDKKIGKEDLHTHAFFTKHGYNNLYEIKNRNTNI